MHSRIFAVSHYRPDNDLRMKNVLVTGGTGFVGSNLVHAILREGCSVRILRRSSSDTRSLNGADVEHLIGDVRDAAAVRRAVQGCDTVFHTAALVSYWSKQRSEMLDVNVGGTANVVRACLDAGVGRLVHTSSVAAVGYTSNGSPATEETPHDWSTETIGYRISKYRAEEEVMRGVRLGLQAVMVNPTVIMGPRDYHIHGGRIVRDIHRRRIFYATPGGTSIVDVDDVVQGHVAAARRGRVGERYILAGENLSFKEVFRITAEEVGGLKPLVTLPRPVVRLIAAGVEDISSVFGVTPWATRELVSGVGRHRAYSVEKARRELGYTFRPYRETVRRTFNWFREEALL